MGCHCLLRSFFLLSIKKSCCCFFKRSMVVYNMFVSGMQQRDSVMYSSLKNIYVFIYLAVPSLSCGMWDLVP